MSTEYFPGKNVPVNNFYLSCGTERETLIGYKTDYPEGSSWHPKPFVTTCPILGLVRVPMPDYFISEAGGAVADIWQLVDAVAERLLGEHDGLYRMTLNAWEAIFKEDLREEWGREEGQKFVYFLISDSSDLFRLHMAFE